MHVRTTAPLGLLHWNTSETVSGVLHLDYYCARKEQEKSSLHSIVLHEYVFGKLTPNR